MIKNRPLIGYIPNVLREVREYQALTLTEEPELALLWDDLQNTLDDQFVLSATKRGVERREKILHITPKATFTLDERKFTILARLAEQLPYSIRMLHKMLTALCGQDGYTIKLINDEYTLCVNVFLNSANRNVIDEVNLMLRRICPANLIVVFSKEAPTQLCHISLTGVAFPSMMSTTLPQYLPLQTYEQATYVAAMRSSISETKLCPIPEEE